MELVHEKTDKWDKTEGAEVDPTIENLVYEHRCSNKMRERYIFYFNKQFWRQLDRHLEKEQSQSTSQYTQNNLSMDQRYKRKPYKYSRKYR